MKNINYNKKAQIDFVWIFALLVGGVILFLAIFGALRTGDTYRYQSDTEVAKSISVITDPLSAGFAEGSYGKIVFRQQARINNICLDGGFGKNDISVSTRSNVGEPWNMAGGATSIYNKYIFSKEQISGLDFYVFSKPFNFPYEVSDLIFITSDNYCFFNTPEEIANEIKGMRINNIQIENCTLPSPINVCFGSGRECDIVVYGSCSSKCNSVYDEGVVSKSNEDMRYVGNLMYAAIFSDKEIYDCNVERLMHRTSKIAEEFVAKANLMDARNCNTNLRGDLIMWAGLTADASSEDLIGLRTMGNNLDDKNERELCGVW